MKTNTENKETIRSYGPGKFSTILDAYVYGVSLDGCCDDEISTDGMNGWFGLMRNGRTIFKDHDPMLETLNDAEQEQLTSCAGVIVAESSDGFVDVTYYDTDEDLNAAWEALQFEYEESGEESEDDETEDE